MSDQVLDIILFAMVAGFLILRLRSVLGRRTGTERPPETRNRLGRGFPTDNVVSLPDRNKPSAADPREDDHPMEPVAERPAGPVHTLQSGLAEIAAADPSFNPDGFLSGARSAFDYIVSAFAAGDTATLRPLLSDEVYDGFAEAIRQRMAAKETLESRIVRLDSADLVDATLQGRTAAITIKFISQQINVTRDADGKVIDGDPERPLERTDIWTFSRNVRAQNPNWVLVATHAL
jgi:predicted lipid-binding transport protein (Tim44 family)